MKRFTPSLHSRYVRSCSLLAAAALFFGVTDPFRLNPPLLIVGFLLAVSTVYYLARSVLRCLSWYGLAVQSREHRTALSITVVIGAIMALQSMGQFGPKDLLLLLPFVLVAYLYLSYGRTAKV